MSACVGSQINGAPSHCLRVGSPKVSTELMTEKMQKKGA